MTTREQILKQFEKKLDYTFKDISLLNESLTHSSYANENRRKNIRYNERLEFLGDAVLSVIISDYLYKHLTQMPEGELTKIRAIIVCEPSLAKCSTKLDVGKSISLGKGEEATGGRNRASILADAFEAIIGAIYLDGGLENAQKFVLNNLEPIIEDAIHGRIFQDYKTQLQEIIQGENTEKIAYEIIDEQGPDHNKIFHVQVKIGDKVAGKGSGKSKKEAEQNAARVALEVIN